MVSLAPPPVAPTRRLPPGLILAVLPGLEPAELEALLLLPQAARSPPALRAAPPARAPCSTCRRVRPWRSCSLLSGTRCSPRGFGIRLAPRRAPSVGKTIGCGQPVGVALGLLQDQVQARAQVVAGGVGPVGIAGLERRQQQRVI